jgi:TetR/AcrR family transcriptional repressor of lmrAB and yxaGH operons
MTIAPDSKQRMIAATATLMQRQGYHATGLNQIVKEARAPKGSLYFHFPGGKEELAETALAEAGKQTRDELLAIVAAQPDPAHAITAVVEWFSQRLVASDFADGCPVATVALEAAASTPRLQQACARHYGDWQAMMAAYLESFGLPTASARSMAALALASIEGALLLARAYRDVAILREIGQELRALVDARLSSVPA